MSIINDLLPEAGTANPSTNPSVKRLLTLPCIVTEDLFAVTINQSYVVPVALEADRIAALLPRLAVTNRLLSRFPKITRLIKLLNLSDVVSHISSMCDEEPVEDVIGVEEKDLRDLYSLFVDLDRQGNVEKAAYSRLRSLPIWKSSRGLVKGTQALLPGNFTDPTGQADLLDTSVLTESARDFLSTKLEIQTQTIEAFVQTVLPTFFDDDGPLDETHYTRLISELANHPTLVNDENIRRLLGSLPIVPTQDGGWSRPVNTYRRADELVKVLATPSTFGWMSAVLLILDQYTLSSIASVFDDHRLQATLSIAYCPLPRSTYQLRTQSVRAVRLSMHCVTTMKSGKKRKSFRTLSRTFKRQRVSPQMGIQKSGTQQTLSMLLTVPKLSAPKPIFSIQEYSTPEN